MRLIVGPTAAAFAPGEEGVVGRMVSAISSIRRSSSALKTREGRVSPDRAQAASTPLDATRAPPNSSPALLMASRRLIMSDVLPLELIDGMIHCPRRERHVQDGRALIPRGGHAGAVGDEDIGTRVYGVPLVEHRGLRIRPHA